MAIKYPQPQWPMYVHQSNLPEQPPLVSTRQNSDEQKFDGIWPSNFSKGLPHNLDGVVDIRAYEMYVDAVNQPDLNFVVPIGPIDVKGVPAAQRSYRPPGYQDHPKTVKTFIHRWFSGPNGETIPTGVRFFDGPLLSWVVGANGATSDFFALDSAPTLDSDELCAEIAEIYSMALLRDVPFCYIENGTGASSLGVPVKSIVEGLNSLPWFNAERTQRTTLDDLGGITQEQRRRLARTREPLSADDSGFRPISTEVLFRCSTSGVKQGPFISQFLFIGTNCLDSTAAMRNQFDAVQLIDSRVYPLESDLDYMTTWSTWLDVQNGADWATAARFEKRIRYITTPRDLATYTRCFTPLQASLSVVFILLQYSVRRQLDVGAWSERASAYSLFTAPGQLVEQMLMTQAATLATMAVCRQKFNYHRRARPEAICGLLCLAGNGRESVLGKAVAEISIRMIEDIKKTGLLDFIHAHNCRQNYLNSTQLRRSPINARSEPSCFGWLKKNYLMPMALPEGSPMHPAYGGAYAAVAGACATMLKAIFQTNQPGGWEPLTLMDIGFKNIWTPSNDGSQLLTEPLAGKPQQLTLYGEINKLAANLAVGRGMAGVNYYSDYYASLRLGERVAVYLLREHTANYPKPPAIRFITFDNDRIAINVGGKGMVNIVTEDGARCGLDQWWRRYGYSASMI